MKKLVISLVLGASLAIVPSAFALKAMTADSMKDTTGQAGVSIAADDIIIYSSAGTTTYTDNNVTMVLGSNLESGVAASVSIEETQGTLTTIRAIFDNTTRGGMLNQQYGDLMGSSTVNGVVGINNFGKTVAGADVYGLATGLHADTVANNIIGRPITIDVDSALQTLSAAIRYKYSGDATNDAAVTPFGGACNVVGVSIGLPTVEICKTGSVKKYTASAVGSANDGREYIQVSKTSTVTAILGGTIEIAPH